jgi:hypothetical protein
MSLGAAEVVYPVTRKAFSSAVHTAVVNTLSNNWNQGKINRSDLDGYLRVFQEGNSPFRGSVIDDTVKQAILDFRARVISARLVSPKTVPSGLEGLDGFLGSIVDAVKGVVTQVINIVKPAAQAAAKTFTTSIEAAAQPATAYPRSEAVQTGYTGFYIALAALGLFAVLSLTGKRGR